MTYIVVGKHTNHVRRHEATERGERVGHTEDGAGEVGRNVQPVAEIAGRDGTIKEEGQREDTDRPGAVLSHVHLNDHQEAGSHHS